MSDADGDAGHESTQAGGNGRKAFDTVMDIIDTAAAADFPFQCFLHHAVVVFGHIGLDGEPVLRGRLDDAHVPAFDKGHMERPGNRRRRQSQHIDAGAPLLHLFLLRHTEALLLIDDEEPKILEMDVRLKDPVGPDQDIELPVRELLQDFLLFLRRAETAQHINPDAKMVHPLPEGHQMLLGQDRRRCHDRHLAAIHDSLESRPDRHLGLAVSHIAAQKAVHGDGFFHIRLDFADGLQLIRGLLKRKFCLELLLPGGIGSKRMALRDLPLGIEPQQFRSQDGDGLFGPFGRPLPVRPSHTGKARRRPFAADVLVQEADLLDGHVQFIAVRVLQLQVIPMDAVDDDRFDAKIAPDALGIMDDIVAGFDIGEIVDGRTLATLLFLAALLLHPENIRFGQEDPVLIPEIESPRKAALKDCTAMFRNEGPAADKGHIDTPVFEFLSHTGRLVPRPHHDERMDSVRDPAVQVFCQDFRVLVVGRHQTHLDMQGRRSGCQGMAQIAYKDQMISETAFPELGLTEKSVRELMVVMITFACLVKKGCRFIQNQELVGLSVGKDVR